jgi:hypothetical protein
MKKLMLIACLVLIGCGAESVNEIVTKNGKKGFAIECSAVADCGNMALVSCPDGFATMSRDIARYKITIECLP